MRVRVCVFAAAFTALPLIEIDGAPTWHFNSSFQIIFVAFLAFFKFNWFHIFIATLFDDILLPEGVTEQEQGFLFNKFALDFV